MDQSTPVSKRPRLKAQPIVLAEVRNIQICTAVCKGLFAGIDCVFASAESVGWACLDMGLERRLNVYFGS